MTPSRVERNWRQSLVEALAEQLWAGYCQWNLETHNEASPRWAFLVPERKEEMLKIAEGLIEEREAEGKVLKKL